MPPLERSQRVIFALCCAGILSLTGCFSDETGTNPSEAGEQVSAANARDVPDLTFEDRFDIELVIKGAPTPNAPLQITARVRGNLATELARIQIMIPEVEAYRLRGAKFHAPLDTPLPSLLSVDQPIGQGQQVVHHATVKISEPGYYRVAVSAQPLRAAPVDVGRRIQDVAAVEQWVYVDQSKGKITPVIDPAVYQSGEYQLIGPRRPRAAPAVNGGALTTANCTWQVKYFASDSNKYFPVQDAEIPVWGSRSFTLRTNALGNFDICPAAGETFNFRVLLRNPRISILQDAIPQVTGITATTVPTDVIFSSVESRVYENMNRTVAEATALFTYTRSVLSVDVTNTVTNSKYSVDKVWIKDTHVWGVGGIFTAAHEYGHAYHEKALGSFPHGTCGPGGDSHRINEAITMTCAWAEGFADFFGAATRRAALFIDYSMERDGFFPGTYDNGTVSRDGSIIEGAVASFLYDIVDLANWPDGSNNGIDNVDDDPLNYGGKYLADVIRTCGVEVRTLAFPSYVWTWTTENAIDFLIYCLENRVDPAVTTNPTYFPQRGSGDPRNQRESATEPPGWNPANIRNQWIWNLYTNP